MSDSSVDKNDRTSKRTARPPLDDTRRISVPSESILTQIVEPDAKTKTDRVTERVEERKKRRLKARVRCKAPQTPVGHIDDKIASGTSE
jgi:hypothetical protein